MVGNVFLYLAIATIIGLLSTRLMKKIKLPNVTGYLLTGIIIGPCVLGLFFNNFDFANSFSPGATVYDIVSKVAWISVLALSFIAFTIGSNFKLKVIKKLGKRVVIVTILESLSAAIFVFIGLTIAHYVEGSIKGIGNEVITWPLILTLSAISCATAPAATLLVIKQYKAEGPVVNTLLPVVALDDVVALIAFSILFGIAKTIENKEVMNVGIVIAKPILEIAFSVVFGAIFGVVISLLCKVFKSRANRSMLCIFAVLANVGMFYLFNSFAMGPLGNLELSYLLSSMMSCAFFVNMVPSSSETLERIDFITPIIFMLFFILSGANLNLTIFGSDKVGILIVIALTYLIFRVVGKYLGAFTGTKITKCEPTVQKYLGLTLIPQAGVAIGLATTAASILGTQGLGGIIIASVLISTIIYELVGPVISKIALQKAGEIKEI